MKCPVCDNMNGSMICPKCGFDSSRDYGKYPTFGAVGKVSSVSALRREWEKKQQKPIPEPVKPTRKKKTWLAVAIAACAAILALGISIGVGLGGGKMEPTVPKETVQMQKPQETTVPTEQTEPPEPTEQTEPPEPTEPQEPRETNILRTRVVPMDNYHIRRWSVFNSQYSRCDIKSVTFVDTLTEMPDDAWDVSAARNRKVMAWVKPNGNLFYDLYIGANGDIWAGESCSKLFAGYDNLERITFAGVLHTENVQDMASMFEGCSKLVSLDLSSFDTSNVQNMDSMFYNCWGLSVLDLSSFDTSNVQDMSSMFTCCNSLTNLKLGDRFVTTNAETRQMFDICPAGDDYQHLLN